MNLIAVTMRRLPDDTSGVWVVVIAAAVGMEMTVGPLLWLIVLGPWWRRRRGRREERRRLSRAFEVIPQSRADD